MEEFSDSELVTKYLAGEGYALDELVRRYFRQVFLFAKTFVHANEPAEDITQESFVKAWKNLKKFDHDKKFKTWLFQIAKNTSIDYLRKHKNLVAAENLGEEQMADRLERITDSSPLPEQALDWDLLNHKLEKLIQSLPPIYKEVMALHLREELTFQEIAEVLNQPINTIKSRYRRALILIREELTSPDGP